MDRAIALLYGHMNWDGDARKNRDRMARIVFERPELLGPLLQIANTGKPKYADRASWLIEYIARRNLRHIDPHIDMLFHGLPSIRSEASLRSTSVIFEMLVRRYFGPEPGPYAMLIKEHHIETLVTSAFDWLLGDHKVATKAHAMECLFWCGLRYNWIHSELASILERNYMTGSAGYRARARKILGRIRIS